MKNLSSTYDASKHEDKIYHKWEKSGAFTPKIDHKKEPFVISMPPPNATGTLHLGHATFLTIEDIMIRYNRMLGKPALWLPGTDHASIATQNKVEKEILKRGLTRQKMGRQAFLKEVHEFVKNSQHIIRNQIRKMGSSCDWTRERYTLDEGLTHSVQEVFKKMYHDKLIYRGHRIVNWCPRCGSTLADDEVEYKTCQEKLYYIKYGPFTLATTRPETKFGDTGLAVHPSDKRYKKYVGKIINADCVIGPIKIQVVADKAVDPKFGTGVVKVTPAHDFTDFEIGQRHNLPVKQAINEEGKMTEIAKQYAGLTTDECRKKIIPDLQKLGLLKKIENYTHNLSVCYRCGTRIEPLVSRQWFIDVNKPIIKEAKKKKTIKEKAIEVVKKGEIKIIPARFSKIYFNWMENLKDWCISRQIWFGHRIPAWYCKNSDCQYHLDQAIVPKLGEKEPVKCPSCHGKIKQDPDTLDTWFSSGLWTFSTLGWPKKTKDLEYFHPTSVMETGYDILFFWIARMIIMTTYNLGEIPFKIVYLHGLVRDKEGRKMSKSLNNGIDPLDMIQKYGADSVRLSLIIGSTPGNDIRLYEEKIAGFRNFINKIWNACRFVLMNMKEEDFKKEIKIKDLTLADKWILTKTQNLIKEIDKDMKNYHFSDAGNKIYDFIWSHFCDWYLEICKVNYDPAVLIYVLKTFLKLLHPFTPFLTETIWEMLHQKEMLILTKWPEVEKKYIFPEAHRQTNVICGVVKAIRSLRADSKVDAGKKIHAIIYGHKYTDIIKRKEKVIIKLANLGSLEIAEKGKKIPESVCKFVDHIEIYLPLKDLLDLDKEKTRLKKEMEKSTQCISCLQNKLKNKNFTEKAPREIVERERLRLEKEIKQLEGLKKQFNSLKIM